MLDAVAAVRSFTEGMTFDEFDAGVLVQGAALYHLIVLGEASVGLPPEIRDRAPSIPWGAIRGTRNRLVHDYFGTDLEVVWRIITNDLEPLVLPLQALLKEGSEPLPA